jgi:CubicO group peptidase (beta-lactamase class C family)
LAVGPTLSADPGVGTGAGAYHRQVTGTDHHRRSADLERALAGADEWPAATRAIAVVDARQVLATRGPVAHRFALASVTKLYAAYAALVAVEEGTLDLDESAGPPGATVRHLLAHASGLGPDSGTLTAPGTRRIYSNAGFDALADHLAERSGMAAVDYVIAAVVEPLGLTATAFTTPSLAHGLTSTLADTARFARELLSPTLVHPDTLGEATTVQFPGLNGVLPGFGAMDPNDWGLGMELRGTKHPHWTGTRCSPRTFGHFGRSGTCCWVDPVAGVALVVLTNQLFGPWAAAAWPRLSDAVLDALGT